MISRCSHTYLVLSLLTLDTARRVGEWSAARLARAGSERGQTTAEYALVLLGAASVALLIAVWARGEGGVGRLLDAVFGKIIKLVR